jgi:predicted nucleic acid-binding protein
MYLVDSSAWIEYLRRTGSQADQEVTRLVERDFPAAGVTEPVIMELFSGERDTERFRDLERLMDAMPLCQVDPVCDFAEAGCLYAALRDKGITIRSRIDCLIAAIAWRRNATLVHADRDFDRIAEHFPELRVMSLV